VSAATSSVPPCQACKVCHSLRLPAASTEHGRAGSAHRPAVSCQPFRQRRDRSTPDTPAGWRWRGGHRWARSDSCSRLHAGQAGRAFLVVGGSRPADRRSDGRCRPASGRGGPTGGRGGSARPNSPSVKRWVSAVEVVVGEGRALTRGGAHGEQRRGGVSPPAGRTAPGLRLPPPARLLSVRAACRPPPLPTAHGARAAITVSTSFPLPSSPSRPAAPPPVASATACATPAVVTMSHAVAMMKGKQVLALTLVAVGSLTCLYVFI